GLAAALLLEATLFGLVGLALRDAVLVLLEGLRRRVLQRRELLLERDEVALLIGERLLGRGLRLASDLHLLFRDLLQAVALLARLLRLIRQVLSRVASRDRVGVDRLVAFGELVELTELRQDLVGVLAGSCEEHIVGGAVTARSTQLRCDLRRGLRGLVGLLRLLVGLRLKIVGAVRGLEELLLRRVVVVRRLRGSSLGLGDRVLQLRDEPLDARDLAGLRRLVIARPFDVVPRRVVVGVV